MDIELKKCPRCGNNYLNHGQEICDVCARELKENEAPAASHGRKAKEHHVVHVDNDFSAARKGHAYGSAARDVYKKFCGSLGWDADSNGSFAQQKNLFAANADTDRTRDVWFICHYNFDFDAHEIDKSGGSTNTIKEGGRYIYEERTDDSDIDRNNRIVFVKENGLYVFYGVYRYKGFDEGKRRIFERYSDVYPVPDNILEHRVCPRCGKLNAFDNGAKLCISCMKELSLAVNVGKHSVLKRNRACGSVARKIYEGFCDSLGWDPDKADCFGLQMPLFARCADTDRKRDVWFVSHAERKTDVKDVEGKGESPIIVIGDGNLIYEIRDTEAGAVIGDRIVFVKVEGMYVFYGVYRLKEYDEKIGARVFERYSDVYPMSE